MPKDPTRNKPNYDISGRHINEYEYQKKKGAITEEEQKLLRATTETVKPDTEDALLINQGEKGGKRPDPAG